MILSFFAKYGTPVREVRGDCLLLK